MKTCLIAVLLGALLLSPPVRAADAPIAPQEPKDVSVHGDPRTDDYAWLREREDPRVLDHLKAENAHTAAWLAPRAAFRDRLYEEMLARVRQDDDSPPYRDGRWWYATRLLQGQQYPLLLRRAALGPERRWDPDGRDEVMLDLNELARGQAHLRLEAHAVSPDGRRLAFMTDATGGRDYVLQVRDLAAGRMLPLRLTGLDSFAWGADGRSLYYVKVDAARRPYQLWRHRLGSGRPDQLLHEEHDELFALGVTLTRDRRWLLLRAESRDSSEVRVLDARRADARPRVLLPRRPDVDYQAEHRAGRFYLRINDRGRNYRLLRVDARRPDLGRAEELIAARPDVMLEDVDLFRDHLVVTERVAGTVQLRVRDLRRGGEHRITFDEAAYSAAEQDNAEFDTTTLRFAYTSLTVPPSIYAEDLRSRVRTLLKRTPVLGGYEPARYATARLTARAADGRAVPISLVWRKDRRRGGPQPLLLYGYGAYGIPSDAYFSSTRLSLLDRGAVFAIAHVRGGGDLGRTWYEDGKMARKMNSFTDFIACAEQLVASGWTRPDQLITWGGSAGGLLVTAAANLRPALFKAVVAEVPFVDVINTMLDESLPLTVGEFLEWGNPKIPEQYAWMRAYSPYDNLKPGAYPAMLIETGLNDSQVAYWEPAKYVARLRALKTDANPLLLQVNLDAGHGGASGRFDALRELSLSYTFMLDQWGLLDD
ncbi:MAG TPA: S9 family peptidase [Methylibium sp.]|nr:S9 family peptidase [Methylibium sp.]